MNVTVQEAVDDLLPPVHVGTGQAKNHARYRLDETTFANVKARLQSQFHVDVGANYPEGTRSIKGFGGASATGARIARVSSSIFWMSSDIFSAKTSRRALRCCSLIEPTHSACATHQSCYSSKALLVLDDCVPLLEHKVGLKAAPVSCV
jgi:hypothetical protein